MKAHSLTLALLTVGLVGLGPFHRPRHTESASTTAAPAPPLARIPPDIVDLFAESLPLPVGPLPEGLASLTAQACGSCHIQAHDSWMAGSHAMAATSGAWRSMAAETADPMCVQCHLPVAEQHARLNGEPNPNWVASLSVEGVTCASCHVREGAVVVGRPGVQAPHPVKWSPQLGSSDLCADCHQLTIGSEGHALYDTFGEWQRSPQGQAGITCQDCHSGPGASGAQLGHDHGPSTRRGRGLSVVAQLATDTVVRGGAPFTGALVLQNTGAGHHIPSGSPFSGLRVEASVVIAQEDAEWQSPVLAHDLVRAVEPAAPYRTIADSRLAAGEERRVPLSFAIPQDAPAGPTNLRIVVFRTLLGSATDDVVQRQEIPLSMD